MAWDINSTSVQRNCLKNEIGEIHFHGGFRCFLQIGRSHDFQWERHDRSGKRIPAIALAAALHQECWNNTLRSLALLHIPLSSTQSADAERVWAGEWVASAILVPGLVTRLKRTT